MDSELTFQKQVDHTGAVLGLKSHPCFALNNSTETGPQFKDSLIFRMKL